MNTFVKNYLELTKPSLTRLVVLTALCGAAVAPGKFSWLQWLYLILGSWGIVASANAINCYLERDVDALMERTKLRPLVIGTIGANPSLAVSLILATLAIALLYQLNLLTAVLGLLGFVLYVAVYTPLKRITMGALFMGAIPGAIPPMMGWTAASGKLDVGAWVLFAILFFWQLPHFIAISLNRLSEYDLAGLKTLPGEMGQELAFKHLLIYTVLLILTSLLPYPLGLAGQAYLSAVILIGICFLALCVVGFFKILNFNWNRFAFFGSLVYLPVVLGLWVFDIWLTQ
jgi:protoheme IX farnesyltransferase